MKQDKPNLRRRQDAEAAAEAPQEIEAIEQALELMDDLEIPEPSADFEERIWHRIQQAERGENLDATNDSADDVEEGAAPYRAESIAATQHRASSGTWGSKLGWMAAAAAVLLAFVAGSIWSPRSEPIAQDAKERLLMARVTQHLQQTGRLLTEVHHADRSGNSWERERERAGQLISDARMVQLLLADDSNPAIRELLSELERVLAEVSNTPDDPTAADLARIKRQIARRGLIQRVRTLRQQTENASTPAPSPAPRNGRNADAV